MGYAGAGVAENALIGYLLTCGRTGAWRGSVQVSGSSLSHRLPAVAWLSFGLRGPDADVAPGVGAAVGGRRSGCHSSVKLLGEECDDY